MVVRHSKGERCVTESRVTSSSGIERGAENSIAAVTELPIAQVEVVRVRRWRRDLMA